MDHHGERAGADRPSSIEQVFELLALPKSLWNRRLTLVAANDRAHVAGLLEAGATTEEILAIRADDRAAQGVTPDDEAEAVRAIENRRREGRLTIIQTTSRTSSAIADLMVREVGGPGYERLLVIMPDAVAVFGDGEAINGLGQSIRVRGGAAIFRKPASGGCLWQKAKGPTV